MTHPFRVASGQIIVNRDDMHRVTGKGIQVDRQRGNQCLAFTRAHLGDFASMQHHAADQLHVEVAHIKNPI